MKKKEIRILDCILKELYSGNNDVVSVCNNLGIIDVDKIKTIRMKLIRDGLAYNSNKMHYSLVISSEGRLFIEKGGYMYKYFKELIAPYTALIGCITGVISFIWLVVEKMILFFS